MRLIISKIFILIMLINISVPSFGLELSKWTSAIDYSRQDRLDSTVSLLFIYSSTCQYCQKFAPILKEFVHQTGVQYKSLTADGGLLDGFFDAIYDPLLLSKLNVKSYPTVLAINQKTQDMVLLSQGYITLADLYENYKVVKSYIRRSAI